MATKQQEKQSADSEKQGRLQMGTLIGKNVLRTLGQPVDLIRVQVRTLWGDFFRVNVFVGPDPGAVKIAHSFFLSADAEGKILSSTPQITKKY
jgi:hypothetical protein